MRQPERIVVVGGGLGGLRVVEELRRLGATGELVLVGSESVPPYDRPPLSKEVLRGDKEHSFLRSDDELAALGVRLELGRTATGLREGVLETDAGELAFDALVIATGGVARVLPGLEDAHYLRSLDEARAAGEAIRTSGVVTVVGGGFIGCEVASSAVAMGARVTLVELLPLPLVRVLGEQVASEVASMHTEAGVDLRTGVSVEGREPDGSLRLSDGSVVDGTTVVVGLGVTPASTWLEGTAVEVGNGVLADEHGRTSVPGVWALGDVAAWWRPSVGEHKRVEHWDVARTQATVVARDVLDLGDDPDEGAPLDYFWSDQHGLKLQVLGSIGPDDEVTLLRSGPKERLVAVYGRDGVATAVFGAGLPRKVMGARGLLSQGASVEALLEHARA